MNTTPDFNDTIAAIATPLGRGGIGVVRVSGPNAVEITRPFIQGAFPKPRMAAYRDFLDKEGQVIDQGIILYFPNPYSFTGETVVEFQGHGSPPVLHHLLKNILHQGARLARPGEFSERAFLNGRLDLTQAEAIADLIDASSQKAARAAMQSLQGAFSKKVQQLNEGFIRLRTVVEAAIDFSEEGIDAPTIQQINQQIDHLLAHLSNTQKEAEQGFRAQTSMRLVLLGQPNAGKSSLLNALTGEDRAITSAMPGTTRDMLSAYLEVEGVPIELIDTAGLHQTDNIIEQEGIKRAIKAVIEADQILWVVDSTLSEEVSLDQIWRGLNAEAIKAPITIIRNKIDKTKESSGVTYSKPYNEIRVSAKTEAGLLELKQYLKACVGDDSQAIGFSARERHVLALAQAHQHLKEGEKSWKQAQLLELLAVHINNAHHTVGQITGIFTTEDLLGHIFSSFCIGK